MVLTGLSQGVIELFSEGVNQVRNFAAGEALAELGGIGPLDRVLPGNLLVGPHTVEFKPIPDSKTPSNETTTRIGSCRAVNVASGGGLFGSSAQTFSSARHSGIKIPITTSTNEKSVARADG